MASFVSNIFKSNILTKKVNLASGGDTIKVALYDNSYNLTAASRNYSTTNELTTTGGYTQGGATLGSQTLTPVDGSAATIKFDAADTAWTSATFTAYYALLYDTTVHATDDNLICSIDFGGAKTVSSGTLTLIWDTDGIITFA
jgi:hypothetical protein